MPGPMLSSGENTKESKLQCLFTSPSQPGTLTGRSATQTPSSMANNLDQFNTPAVGAHHPQNAHLWPAL